MMSTAWLLDLFFGTLCVAICCQAAQLSLAERNSTSESDYFKRARTTTRAAPTTKRSSVVATNEPALAAKPLLIGAFNAQIFGQKKASDPIVMNVIAKIVSRYDIMVFQEIRDVTATAAQSLLNLVNRPEKPYAMVISTRLGRTSSKEQYAFYYRSDKVQVISTYQFPDIDDWFQREPFTVRFRAPNAAIDDFAIMAIHTEPTDAVNETSRLVDVYDTVRSVMSLEDVLIAGDFNADCTYIYGSAWNKVRLWTDPRFAWLISDCADTTATETDCAYDRFVAAGSRLQKAVVPGTATPFVYSSPVPAVNISDHYPVEVAISGKPNVALQQLFSATTSLTITSAVPAIADALTALRRPESANLGRSIGFDIWESTTSGIATVFASKTQVSDVLAAIAAFKSTFPGVVNDGMAALLSEYFQSNNTSHRPYVYGLESSRLSTFDIAVRCSGNDSICKVVVDCHLH